PFGVALARLARPPQRDQSLADVLVNRPAVLPDDAVNDRPQLAHQLRHVLRVLPFGERQEAREVCEEDGQLAALLGRLLPLRRDHRLLRRRALLPRGRSLDERRRVAARLAVALVADGVGAEVELSFETAEFVLKFLRRRPARVLVFGERAAEDGPDLFGRLDAEV